MPANFGLKRKVTVVTGGSDTVDGSTGVNSVVSYGKSVVASASSVGHAMEEDGSLPPKQAGLDGGGGGCDWDHSTSVDKGEPSADLHGP